MISLLLFERIAQMFLIIVVAYIFVRLGFARSDDSRLLSMMCLYVVTPCIMFNSYQIEVTDTVLQRLALTAVMTVVVFASQVLIAALMKRPFHLDEVEQSSIIYTNCGNLLIPVVSYILGNDWLIYVTFFWMIQIVFFWSHARMLISGERSFSLVKLIKNPNIIASILGLLCFVLHIRMPVVVTGTMDLLSSTVGPLSMFTIGMVLASLDLKKLVTIPGVWKVVVLRLIVSSGLVVLLLKFSGAGRFAPEGENVLLILVLVASAPAAATVTQMAQIFSTPKRAEYASAVNVLTTLLCIVTMPLMVSLFLL